MTKSSDDFEEWYAEHEAWLEAECEEWLRDFESGNEHSAFAAAMMLNDEFCRDYLGARMPKSWRLYLALIKSKVNYFKRYMEDTFEIMRLKFKVWRNKWLPF